MFPAIRIALLSFIGYQYRIELCYAALYVLTLYRGGNFQVRLKIFSHITVGKLLVYRQYQGEAPRYWYPTINDLHFLLQSVKYWQNTFTLKFWLLESRKLIHDRQTGCRQRSSTADLFGITPHIQSFGGTQTMALDIITKACDQVWHAVLLHILPFNGKLLDQCQWNAVFLSSCSWLIVIDGHS